jgi:hypothetical protein
MLTKQRMLDMIDFIDNNILCSEQTKKFFNEISTEDRNFLIKIRSISSEDLDLTIRSSLEKYCYDLSLDKVIDVRNKRIDEILNQI